MRWVLYNMIGTHPKNIQAIATNGLLRIGHPLNPSTSNNYTYELVSAQQC
jgi:hypothetical protein